MPSKNGSLRTSLIATAGFRLLTLPISALASIAVQFLALRRLGIENFGILSLITSLPMLLPFLDLGLGTSLINAHASRDRESAKEHTLVAWTLLWLVILVLLVLATLVQLIVGWERILGADVFFAGPIGPVLFVLLTSICIPFGVGARILVGLGQVARVTQIQILFPIVNLTLGLIAFATRLDFLFILGPALGQLSVGVVGFALAARRLAYPLKFWWRLSLRRSGHIRGVLRSAWPMLVVSAGVAIALNSHRVVLAHLSTSQELSHYSIAMVYFTPALGLVNQVLVNLWPHFAREREASGQLGAYSSFWTILQRGVLILVPYSMLFVAIGPAAYYLLTGSWIGPFLWICLGILMLVQGIQGIIGMYLTSPEGLRYQAVCITVMVLLALALMTVLTPRLGAPGPIVAAASAVLVAQILPGIWLIRRQGAFLKRASDMAFAQ